MKSKEQIEKLISDLETSKLLHNSKEYNLAYYYANRESRLKRDKELYHSKSIEDKRKRNNKNAPDYSIKWRRENPEYMSKYMKRRRKEKPALVKAEERQKDITRKQSLLKLAKLYKDEINQIYNNCPENLVVDHIIPIQGKNVSGLNVPWNMQYLNRSENNFKRHSFDNTYHNEFWRVRYKKHYS